MQNFEEHTRKVTKGKNETEESEERKWTNKTESGLQKLQPSKMSETYALDFRFNAEKWKT